MTGDDTRPGAAGSGRITGLELLGLGIVVLVAALTRLQGLDVRGPFDADQGNDMLTLAAMLRGELPLLGPPTSIGTFHHGAAYYYLLAPAAFASGADPVAVTSWIAIFGIGAVVATWWLGRELAGPVAAFAAGGLAAISPAGIDESTFIWNPNLIPVASALAFGAALHAWRGGRPWWWLVAGLGAMVTMQCHILGVVVVPPLAFAFAADLRRRHSLGHPLRSTLLAGIGAGFIIVAGYLPLAIHELTRDFSESRAILEYIAGGGRSGSAGLVETAALVGLRSITWPLVGLVTERPTLSILVAITVVGLMAVAALASGRPTRMAARWLIGAIAWCIVALAVFAPSLATVVPGLPNDHYHSFLDPLVIALVAAGLARLITIAVPRAAEGSGPVSEPPTRVRVAAGVMAGVVTVALVGASVVSWPPTVAADGGWRSAERDAVELEAYTAGRPYALVGIPDFKQLHAIRFPLQRLGSQPPDGADLDPAQPLPLIVFVCDPMFDEVVGAPCGGAAEDAWVAERGLKLDRLTTWEGGPRRVFSVYAGQ